MGHIYFCREVLNVWSFVTTIIKIALDDFSILYFQFFYSVLLFIMLLLHKGFESSLQLVDNFVPEKRNVWWWWYRNTIISTAILDFCRLYFINIFQHCIESKTCLFSKTRSVSQSYWVLCKINDWKNHNNWEPGYKSKYVCNCITSLFSCL